MHRAAQEHPGAILAVGNAPTALLTIAEEIEAGLAGLLWVIAVPVGFVNGGGKQGDAVCRLCRQRRACHRGHGPQGRKHRGAAVCNALVYSAAEMLDPAARGWK